MSELTPFEIIKFQEYLKDLKKKLLEKPGDPVGASISKIIFHYIIASLDAELKYADKKYSQAMDR